MSVLSFLILCVLEVTVLLTAYIYDSQIFAEMVNIFRVIWVMVLVLANWLASTVIFFKNKNITKSPDFGVVPAINISVFIWSILSVLAMVFLADFSMRTHMIVQVILAGGIAFLVLSMMLGSAAAKTDHTLPKILKTDLAILVKQLEHQNPKQSELLKSLREKVLYSLPHDSKLAHSKDYQELVERIQIANQDSSKLNKIEIQKLNKIINNCSR